MTTIVIPVRPGEDNDELRYTLRTIAAHVHDPDVWIIGHKPLWVRDVHHLPTRPRGRKSDRGCQQTRAAANHPDLPDAWWWWDDDMYRLTPLYGPEVRHGGTITEWLDRYQTVDSHYCRALLRTAALLPDDALMYDLHLPMWIPDKQALADTMRSLPDGHGGWLWRTIHGNTHHLGGTGHPDVKVYVHQPIPDPPGQWISSDDRSFPRLRHAILEPRYPNLSPWEWEPVPVTYRRGDYTRRVAATAGQHQHLIDNGWQLA